MKTPPIINPASVSSSPAPAKQSNAGNSDVPFNQVLSREVADRSNAGDAGKSGSSQTGNTATPSQPTAKPAGTKPASAKSSNDDKSKETTDAAQANGSEQAPTAATQLLVLAADLGSLRPIAADASPPVTDTTALNANADATPITATVNVMANPFATALNAGAGTAAATPNVDAGTIATAPNANPVAATGNTDQTLRVAPPDLPASSAATGVDKEMAVKPATDFAATLKPGTNTKQMVDLKAPGNVDARTASATPATELAASAKAQEVSAPSQAAPDLSALKAKEMPATTATIMAPLQQGAFDARALTGHPTEKLTPQVGTPAWDQALGQKVVWMVAGAQQSATLSLNPPDLGPLQVVLNVSNSQATATFTAAQPEVRQALEAALPKLREMLGDAGIQLGQATVGSGNQSPNWTPGGDQPQQGGARVAEFAGDKAAAAPHALRGQAAGSGQGLVDTFA